MRFLFQSFPRLVLVLMCTASVLLVIKIAKDEVVLQKIDTEVDAEELKVGAKEWEGHEYGSFGSWNSGQEKAGPELGKEESKERYKEDEDGKEKERDQEEKEGKGKEDSLRGDDDEKRGAEIDEKKIHEHERRFKVPPTSHILLLGSPGRVGSSFLGDLLSTLPGSLYVFEPFHDLGKLNLLHEPTATKGAKSIMTCEMRNPLLSSVSRGLRNTKCKFRGNCFSPYILNRVCKTYAIRIIKTVRMRVAWLPILLRDKALDLRVIHMVRDPRPVLLSIWTRGWNIKAEKTCSNFVDDLRAGRQLEIDFPGRYMAVRYEDICLNPIGEVTKITKFLGYPKLPGETLRAVIEHTKWGDPRDVYSTFRNAKNMVNMWRSQINNPQLQFLEGVCSAAIRAFGFRLFGTIPNVRNLSLSFYNHDEEESYF